MSDFCMWTFELSLNYTFYICIIHDIVHELHYYSKQFKNVQLHKPILPVCIDIVTNYDSAAVRTLHAPNNMH